MPPELHAELARAADRAGTSLNQLITTTLAAAVGLDDTRPHSDSAPQADDGRPRLVLLVLAANAVVVGLAAAAAVAILLVAVFR
jgi:hypothetical protein